MPILERKSPRLASFNYNTAGAYFITICVKDHKQLLSHIITEANPLLPPRNELSPFGQVADDVIQQMSSFYTNLSFGHYVIMPNHIHLLISISHTSAPSESRQFIISRLVGSFKRFCNKEYGENIWQSRYYDHVIRNDLDYATKWQYIDTNIQRWEKDELHPGKPQSS